MGRKSLSVQVDEKGGYVDRRKDESLSKERLAEKPFKFKTECGRHLSIGFNLETAQLTLKHNGDDVEKLPEVEKELPKICRNKITKSSTGDQRMTQFHTIYDNVRHVISVTYFKKRKYLEVRLNKAKEFVSTAKNLRRMGCFLSSYRTGRPSGRSQFSMSPRQTNSPYISTTSLSLSCPTRLKSYRRAHRTSRAAESC